MFYGMSDFMWLALCQDPYGEETETEEADEETRADVACATDAKRLVVCKKTGETTLHKAARLGYEVRAQAEAMKIVEPNM